MWIVLIQTMRCLPLMKCIFGLVPVQQEFYLIIALNHCFLLLLVCLVFLQTVSCRFSFLVEVSITLPLEILINQEPPSEPWLKERFIIVKTESEPQEWSHYEPEEFDDDESVISIHSHLH